jgi:hypothetical protein
MVVAESWGGCAMTKLPSALLISLVLVAGGCQKKNPLVAKVDAVYTPVQVLKSDRRLGAAQLATAAVPLPDGDVFLVISSRITNPTKSSQSFDQDSVRVVDEYDNTFSRIGLTVDCSDAPSVMEYDSKLDKLEIKPGQTLAGDAQATCFVFTVPASDRRFSLRMAGATDAPAPLPAAKRAAAIAASTAAPAENAPPPSSDGPS